MTRKALPPSEDEILLSFSVEPSHDRKTLEHYLAEYPEHASALLECSLELMLTMPEADDDIDTPHTDAVDVAWQQFQITTDKKHFSSHSNIFTGMDTVAYRSLVKRLNISSLLLSRLRDRAIDISTIPQSFLRKVALAMGTTVDSVTKYLSGPPSMMSAQSFRSSVKPSVEGKISFAVAIKTSQLTAAQQAALMTLGE